MVALCDSLQDDDDYGRHGTKIIMVESLYEIIRAGEDIHKEGRTRQKYKGKPGANKKDGRPHDFKNIQADLTLEKSLLDE